MAILYFFVNYGLMILHKILQVILSKNEAVTAIFMILDFLKIFFKFQILLPHWGPKAPS